MDTSAPEENEGVEITPTGLVHLHFAGTDYWMRRPKIGEMRRLEEIAVAIAKDHLANMAANAAAVAAAAAEPDPEAPESPETLEGVVEAQTDAATATELIEGRLLGWWRDVAVTLEQSRQTLPGDDDELPPWLANFDLVNEVRRAWRSLPWLAAPR